MYETKFNMNDILKDKVTGFKGQVLGITFYATGCTHYGLAATTLKADGTLRDWVWLDEKRVVLVKAAKNEPITKPVSGPDMNPVMR